MKISYETIPIEKIHVSPFNPRHHVNEKAFRELVESIRKVGVLTPLLVRPNTSARDGYEIAAGHRRYNAAKEIGLSSIPAIIREMNDIEFLEIITIENLQRMEMSLIRNLPKPYSGSRDGDVLIETAKRYGIDPKGIEGEIQKEIKEKKTKKGKIKKKDKNKKTIKPESGVCQICGCTHETPCMDAFRSPCAWTDKTKTLCTACAKKQNPNWPVVQTSTKKEKDHGSGPGIKKKS